MTRLILTIFLIVFNCQFIKTVQSSSTGNLDGNKRGSSEEIIAARQAFLQELSGTHLRSSANSIDTRRTNNATSNETGVIYGGWMVDAADYMGQASFQKWSYTDDDAVSQKMMRLAESGLIDHWRKKVTPRIKRSDLEIRRDGGDARKILTLVDLSGLFTLFICGCALSFFVFFIEKWLLYHNYNYR